MYSNNTVKNVLCTKHWLVCCEYWSMRYWQAFSYWKLPVLPPPSHTYDIPSYLFIQAAVQIWVAMDDKKEGAPCQRIFFFNLLEITM